MLPAGILNIILGATTEDLMIKVIMLIAGIVTVALSCLIASYLRHLENHSKILHEFSEAIDKKLAAQVTQCTSKMSLILKVLGHDEE
jgi:hypothetical protein